MPTSKKITQKFRALAPLATVILIVVVIMGFLMFKPSSETRQQVLGDNYFSYSPMLLEEGQKESSAVLLNFYATWCGSCNEFEPTIKKVMEEIGTTNNIRAYRINFGDGKETKEGRELAKQYGVTVQTTTIILSRSGKVFKTYFTPVSAEELKTTLLAATLA